MMKSIVIFIIILLTPFKCFAYSDSYLDYISRTQEHFTVVKELLTQKHMRVTDNSIFITTQEKNKNYRSSNTLNIETEYRKIDGKIMSIKIYNSYINKEFFFNEEDLVNIDTILEEFINNSNY